MSAYEAFIQSQVQTNAVLADIGFKFVAVALILGLVYFYWPWSKDKNRRNVR